MNIAALPLPEWLREVDVTDDRAAAGITPAALVDYLAAKGWTMSSDVEGCQFWRHPAMPPGRFVLVPQDESYVDYQRRTVDLARSIARHEKRGMISVLHDLHTTGCPDPPAGRRG